MAKAELNKKTSELEVKIVADKAVWKTAQENAFNALGKEVQIKGFRKGNVPADVLKKHVSQQEIMQKAITKMLDKMVIEAAKEIKDDMMVLDSPTYKVDKVSDAELEVTFLYPVYPDIKLADYKSLGIKYVEENVDKKAVDNELERIQKSKSTLENKDGKVAKGDIVIIDFEGSIDGKLFEGGASKGHNLEIGSGQFIPGFEDQLIGLEKGQTKDVKVTFPKEYHSVDLKGKDAVFKVLLQEIKTKKSPEINDAFVQELAIPDVKTVADFKAYIKKVFTEQSKHASRKKFQIDAFSKIIEKTPMVIPVQLIGKEMQAQEKRFEEEIKQQGLTVDKYVELTGIKKETLYSQFRQAAEARLKESLIFAEIAKAEKIELTDADYEAEYKKLAKVYGQSEDSIKGVISKQQMQIPMTNDKVIDTLIKYNK